MSTYTMQLNTREHNDGSFAMQLQDFVACLWNQYTCMYTFIDPTVVIIYTVLYVES